MEAVLSALRSFRNKILTMIQRGTVHNQEPYVAGTYPTMQISAMKKTVDVEIVNPYGFASVPPIGSLAVKFNVQGSSSNQVGVAYDPKTIPAHNPAETVIGAFSASIPTYLKFTQQGTIEIWKGGVPVIMDLVTHLHAGVTTGGDLSGPPVP